MTTPRARDMTCLVAVVSLLVSGLVAAGCALTRASVTPRADDPSIRYALTNLHPDEGRRRLYTVNFQQPGLIPRCTAVRFVETRDSFAIFEIASSGRRYLYLQHASTRESLEQSLARYFGPRCDAAVVAALSPMDQDGIARGKALPGMSKDAVVLAIGYPPQHGTPNLTADVWTYWKSRFRTFEVEFVDGKVTHIKE